jgi:hypothetical protein
MQSTIEAPFSVVGCVFRYLGWAIVWGLFVGFTGISRNSPDRFEAIGVIFAAVMAARPIVWSLSWRRAEVRSVGS